MTSNVVAYPEGTRTYPEFPGNPPSVTSILRHCWPTPELDAWKLREVANTGKLDESAAKRGARIHAYAEAIAKGTGRPTIYRSDFAYVDALEQFHRDHVSRFIASELRVWNPQQEYAGRIDQVAVVDGENTLIDYKTSARADASWYPDNALQLAAYSMTSHCLADHISGSKPTEIGFTYKLLAVVRLCGDGSYEVQWVHRGNALNSWFRCLDLWHCYLNRALVWRRES